MKGTAAVTSTEIHAHRDPHGRRLYVTTDADRIVLVVTTPTGPGVARVEFTPGEWQTLTAAVGRTTVNPTPAA
jgi:hypothetical protein